jgi:hypothetical protein
VTRWLPALALSAVACEKQEPVPPADLTDTGWFDPSTTAVPPPCEDRLVTTAPEAGEDGWYWRDRPTVYVESSVREAYDAWLVEAATGARIDPELAWNEEGTAFTLEWDGHLDGGADYSLFVSDCEATVEAPFRTGPLGAPLAIDDDALQGRTYLLALGDADWVEPPVLGGLIQVYFTTPILLGVRYVDGAAIDLLAAPGVVDPLGNVSQDRFADTWNFPLADFSGSPFVDATAPQIELTYDAYGTVVAIPVTSFVLQGTFSASGDAIGGAVLEGIGDTRTVGALLGDDRPEAICDLAAGAGVTCMACPDGGEYCLRLRAEDLEGTWIPGLSLVER